MRHLLIIIICFPLYVGAQPLTLKGSQSGIFSLGVRTTVSTFNQHHDEGTGLGVGGQFRLQFSNRVNSDWFFDYITSDVGDYANRTDYHVGWSVLYYLTEKPSSKIRPYILAGHCFDYTKIAENSDHSNYAKRLSSAVQAGVGVHVNLTPRLDLSFVGQYMLHLGKEIHTENHQGFVHFEEESHRNFEGHLLINVGINYKIADLW